MFAPVGPRLAIVLGVLKALLKVPFVSVLVVLALLVFVAILLLALLCGNCGSPARRAKSSEGHPKRHYP
jgi:hypothetical protein